MPRTHVIRRLLGILRDLCKESSVVEEFVKSNRSLLVRLEEAYLASRYLPKRYEKEETEELVDFAEKVIDFVRNIRFNLKMRKMIENWKYWVEKIAAAAKKVLGDCEVYVFGSVAEGTWTGGSDVDILIVCNRRIDSNKERGGLKALIEEKAGLPLFHPFEIHIVDKKEAEWYWRHIKKYMKVD